MRMEEEEEAIKAPTYHTVLSPPPPLPPHLAVLSLSLMHEEKRRGDRVSTASFLLILPF